MNRILVVDDERLFRSGLTRIIEGLSDTHVVSGTAANGKEALNWLDRNYADMCVTDVRMPKLDGLELIREINARYPWMNCVVVSSHDDFNDVRESMRLGAVDYVLKPVNRETLGRAIERTLHKINESRFMHVSKLLLHKLPHHRDMLDLWVEQVRTMQHQSMPLLIVDTLEMLEGWIDEKFYYLNPLAMAWLGLVCEELKRHNVDVILREGEDMGLGDRTIPRENTRGYFRLCAVRRLEEGATLLFDRVRSNRENTSRKAIHDVKRYINSHYAEKLSLKELADIGMVSRNYIAVLFKKGTGMTIWNYLVEVRMRKARELLLGTHKKIYEISNEVGYENNVHFSQLFKKHYGFAPAEYRRRMEG